MKRLYPHLHSPSTAQQLMLYIEQTLDRMRYGAWRLSSVMAMKDPASQLVYTQTLDHTIHHNVVIRQHTGKWSMP